MIVSDNVTELTPNAVLSWSGEAKVEWHYMAPGRPMQKGYIESFDSGMRDELLKETPFLTLAHARAVIRSRADDYNTERPHSSVGYAPRGPSPPSVGRRTPSAGDTPHGAE